MDQFDITVCDIELYEKEYLVLPWGVHFGDSSGIRAKRAGSFPGFCAAAGGDDTLVDHERKSKRCGINI